MLLLQYFCTYKLGLMDGNGFTALQHPNSSYIMNEIVYNLLLFIHMHTAQLFQSFKSKPAIVCIFILRKCHTVSIKCDHYWHNKWLGKIHKRRSPAVPKESWAHRAVL